MKELSIEEKAKAYDDLLVKLQKAKVDNNVCDDRYCCVIDDIVPELKESEDERIRKALLEMVHDTTGDSLWVDYDVHKEDAIAWLEKQGEQKQELLTKEKALKNSPFVEQKPAEWTAEDEEELKIALDTLEEAGQYSSAKWLKNVCLVPQTTQKPTKWSEEEEKNIDFLIHLIEHNVPNHSFAFGDGCAYGCKSKEEAINMLKSLKDRVQPKQEWSEEDKDILFRTINNLKFLRDTISTDPNYAVNISDTEREIAWLKSLRPQNRWKPSDEQMRELSIVATGKGYFSKDILSELLEQLKKLKN